MPDLAIIIPHLNDLDRLCQCLDALAGQVGAGVEVFVVDNGSREDQRPSRLPAWVTVLEQPLKGAGLARNLGVAASRSGRLAFLDSDCVPAPNWVAQAQTVPVQRRIVGGCVATFDEGQGRRTGSQLFERVFAFDNERYVTKMGFSVTANMVTSRRVFDALGLFRADVAEDFEWCRRAPQFGVDVVYDGGLSVSHPTRGDWPALRRKWRRLARERFAAQGASALGRAAWAGRAVLTGLSILRDGPKVMCSPRIEGASQRLKCIATLCRIRLARAAWMGRQSLTGKA